jgi:hypothetical protein
MEKIPVSLLQKLDGLLVYLEKQRQPPIKTIGEITEDLSTSLNTDQSELLLLLGKLIEDKYASSEERQITKYGTKVATLETTIYYIITFNGRFFISYSGYVKQYELTAFENTRLASVEDYQRAQSDTLNRLTRLVAWGTIAASIIAFLLLLWEVRHPIIGLWHHFF